MLYIIFLLACSSKQDSAAKTNAIISQTPAKQEPKSPPIIHNKETPVPSMPQGLPTWDDLEAPKDIYQPVAALALSFDHNTCYKEWFQGDSLTPNVRKFQGRILSEGEPTIGRMIQCPEEKKAALLKSLLVNP